MPYLFFGKQKKENSNAQVFASIYMKLKIHSDTNQHDFTYCGYASKAVRFTCSLRFRHSHVYKWQKETGTKMFWILYEFRKIS